MQTYILATKIRWEVSLACLRHGISTQTQSHFQEPFVGGFSAERARERENQGEDDRERKKVKARAAPPVRGATRTPHRPHLGTNLQRYGRDLTADAASGLLDPVIGRGDVLERALQILSRRTKNNPVFIGDPGVGKTALAEGLAQMAVSPKAPPTLRGRAIVSLDLGSIVSGTQYRGSFEERLQGIIADVQAASGHVILFIDEIHMLLETGKIESSSTNAANLLKPSLARGELRCIGATTVEEYRRHIEADPALARRLQPIMVEEPTREEAVAWLKALAPRYEAHHGVRFAPGVCEASVMAAHRFIPDRRQPDSALDILDETAAMVHLRASSIDNLLHRTDGSIQDREFETKMSVESSGRHPHTSGHQGTLEAVSGTNLRVHLPSTVNIDASKQRVIRPDRAVSCPHCGTPTDPAHHGTLTVECPSCSYRFLNIPPEKLMLGSSLFLNDKNILDAERSQRISDVEKTGGDNSSLFPLEDESYGDGDGRQQSVINKDRVPLVQVQDILLVVASASNIPFERVVSAQAGWHSLAHLEDTLSDKVLGQEDSVAAVATAVRLGGVLNPSGSQRRPLSSMLLHGPAGTGKFTLCNALAEALFGTERALISFDLSQATDKTAVARLIGAAPGYVGYGEGGALTEAIRKRPHAVVVFESSHLAHADVLALIRQVLEEGELRDSMGRRADFRNSIVVLTVQEQSPRERHMHSAPGTNKQQSGRSRENEELPTKRSQSLSMPGSSIAASELAVEAESDGNIVASMSRKQRTSSYEVLPEDILAQLDAVIAFRDLSPTSKTRIVARMIEDAKRTLEPLGIDLDVTNSALLKVVEEADTRTEGLQSIVKSRILGPSIDAAFKIMEQRSSLSRSNPDNSHAPLGLKVRVDGQDAEGLRINTE